MRAVIIRRFGGPEVLEVALQFAALRGLRTVAAAAPGDKELVQGLGAGEFVARTADLGGAVRQILPDGVDGALDAAVTARQSSRWTVPGAKAGTQTEMYSAPSAPGVL